MNRRELLTGAAALAAYHSLPAPAEALSLSETFTLLGTVRQPPPLPAGYVYFVDPDTGLYQIDPDTGFYMFGDA